MKIANRAERSERLSERCSDYAGGNIRDYIAKDSERSPESDKFENLRNVSG